jgi:hypothetical protein
MKIVQSDSYSAHQDVTLLLPWYVNRTLRGAELKQVEEHLGICLTCKREVLNLQKLALVVNKPSAFDTAEQAAFMQLKKRLHQMPPTAQPITPDVLSLAQHKAAKRPGIMLWTSSRPTLALAAVLLLSLIIPSYFKLNQMPGNDYRTLSEGSMAISHSNDIHLMFADNTTPEQINNLLATFAGQIVGNPTEQAVYTVRFEQIHTKDALLNQIAQLKKNPQVIFAEPAYALLATPSTESNLK